MASQSADAGGNCHRRPAPSHLLRLSRLPLRIPRLGLRRERLVARRTRLEGFVARRAGFERARGAFAGAGDGERLACDAGAFQDRL